jgi:hypothetical protein
MPNIGYSIQNIHGASWKEHLEKQNQFIALQVSNARLEQEVAERKATEASLNETITALRVEVATLTARNEHLQSCPPQLQLPAPLTLPPAPAYAPTFSQPPPLAIRPPRVQPTMQPVFQPAQLNQETFNDLYLNFMQQHFKAPASSSQSDCRPPY